MSWLNVILFAAAAGVYTGIVMLFPALQETSFQDIGISYEWWVIFAVIVVVNCHKSWEAALKCFVFFLISQPVVYLVEIIAGSLELEQGWRYYYNFWLPMTFLTLPGGFIAYFCSRQTIPGSIVLGLGNTIQAFMGLVYFAMAAQNFPRHLLSALVCVASIFIMTLSIQKQRRNRLIAILLPVVLVAILLVLMKLTGRVLF